ncbi:hypothetical protein CCGE531_09015 [Rhizobium sp. CCGE531]|nr:hypothetical protein CCGE531_09015 [Rhizobium sp. CCGE531]
MCQSGFRYLHNLWQAGDFATDPIWRSYYYSSITGVGFNSRDQELELAPFWIFAAPTAHF